MVNVVAALIANREPAIFRKPGQCALHNPPVPPQLLAALLALSCYPALDGTLSQSFFALFVVVGFVGVKLLGRFLGLPRGRLTGSMASINSSNTIESWTLAAVSIIASGTPLRFETRWRFEPTFPLSVGFFPVFAPPFCRDGCRVQRSALPLYLVGFAKTVQKHSVQPLPYTCLLPLTQSAPARNSRATAHLLGQHLPGNAAP